MRSSHHTAHSSFLMRCSVTIRVSWPRRSDIKDVSPRQSWPFLNEAFRNKPLEIKESYLKRENLRVWHHRSHRCERPGEADNQSESRPRDKVTGSGDCLMIIIKRMLIKRISSQNINKFTNQGRNTGVSWRAERNSMWRAYSSGFRLTGKDKSSWLSLKYLKI